MIKWTTLVSFKFNYPKRRQNLFNSTIDVQEYSWRGPCFYHVQWMPTACNFRFGLLLYNYVSIRFYQIFLKCSLKVYSRIFYDGLFLSTSSNTLFLLKTLQVTRPDTNFDLNSLLTNQESSFDINRQKGVTRNSSLQ